jgi:hypothetical protein
MQILDRKRIEDKEITQAGGDLCKECQVRPAEIFQVNGNFCLECWQIITHTNS